MEYHILRLYQKEKEQHSDVEQGFSRYTKRTRIIVIGSLLGMCLFFLLMFIALCKFHSQFGYYCSFILLLCDVIVLFLVDSYDEKKHMEKYADSHQKKIEILDKILIEKFNINSRTKVDELIEKYQKYINKKEKTEKNRNRIIYTLFSALAGALSISFVNLDIIGIGFTSWLVLATFISLFVGTVGIWIHSCTYFNSTKKKYEMMIQDLEDLELLKY